MSVPRWWRSSGAGTLAVVAIVLCSLPVVGSVAARGVGAPSAGDAGCPGAPVRSSYAGALSAQGGPLTSSALAGVSIAFTYSYQTNLVNESTGTPLATTCTTKAGDVLTSLNGTFALALSVPSSVCSQETRTCDDESGPLGPLSVAPALGPPAGYQTVTTVDGGSVSIVFVAELAGLHLDPAGPVAAYSPSATETIVAEPTTGDGGPTPVTPQYTWTLDGSGWRFAGDPAGSEANLTAAPGAGPGTVTVVARLVVGGTTLVAGPANLSLEAVPTALLTASENRSEVDAGGRVAVAVTASGAPGYNYTAVLLPGLGLSSLPLACSTGTPGPTEVFLSCAVAVTYPSPGVGTPEVVVSNGFSTATEELASVTVDAVPSLEVAPVSPLGYAGAPVLVQVTAVAGMAPYREACLDPGGAPVVCTADAGPTWAFDPVYATTGTFAASAWAVDADGENASVAVDVAIAPPLALGAISYGPHGAAAGELANLSANLTGGFLPGRYWWNVSDVSAPVATGATTGDGPLGAEWVPTAAGSVVLSLTVVDSLGTAVERSTVVSVGPDPAFSVSAVALPPADPVMAGTAVGLAWQGFDAAGAPAVAFVSDATLGISGPAGAVPADAWVNVSGFGPLVASSPGLFPVPSGAWTLGRLNLSVATVSAGAWTVQLADLAGVPAPAPLEVDVGPDLGHLRLYDPEVRLPGDRTNDTFWHLEDRFGNPAAGTWVDVDFSSLGYSQDSRATVVADPDGTSGVWVNYSAPSPAGGSVEVVGPVGGAVLLGPIPVPAAGAEGAAPGLLVWVVGGLLVVAAFGAVAGGRLRQRRRTGADPPGELSEADLRRFVEGRDRVVSLVGEAGVADLTQIEAAWAGSPPPAQLSDWVASLVADGTLGARTGPDGVARFCLATSPLGPARVILNEEALVEAARLREALLNDPADGRGEADGDAQDGSRPTRS
jgi:hypothetical protein